jgi:hypothetical protein
VRQKVPKFGTTIQAKRDRRLKKYANRTNLSPIGGSAARAIGGLAGMYRSVAF